jgi:hypothetical protein
MKFMTAWMHSADTHLYTPPHNTTHNTRRTPDENRGSTIARKTGKGEDEPFAEQFDLLLVDGIEQGEPPIVADQLEYKTTPYPRE